MQGLTNNYESKRITTVCSLFLISAVVIFATPLSSSSGTVMLFCLCAVFVSCEKTLYQKDMLSILIGFCAFALYLGTTSNAFQTVYAKNALVLFCTMTVVTLAFPRGWNIKEMVVKEFSFFDVIYFALYIWCVFELLQFAMSNLSNWTGRYNAENATFSLGLHHVDFALITALVTAIGIKRGYYLSANLLAIVAWIILPARTFKLFYVLFLFGTFFRKWIYKIWRFGGKTRRWMLLLIMGSFAFSWFWIFILNANAQVMDTHTGLNDTSNYERFQTILYAGEVIVKEKLLFCGIDTTLAYDSIVQSGVGYVYNGPHNSYVSILLYYSVFFGGAFLLWLSNLIDRVVSEESIPLIFSYLLTCCILHDMLTGIRLFLFLVVLLIPRRESKSSFMLINKVKRICKVGKQVEVESIKKRET